MQTRLAFQDTDENIGPILNPRPPFPVPQYPTSSRTASYLPLNDQLILPVIDPLHRSQA